MAELNIVFILGTRPEILKMASVIDCATANGCRYQIIHTGQHYHYNMSQIFFEDLMLPEPDFFLEIGSKTPGEQTGETITELEKVFYKNIPEAVVVVGDTNSALSGALAAVKMRIPVVHFESGARSFDWTMPEEINRRLIDSIAAVCFAPTEKAYENLKNEGRVNDAYIVGDTLNEIAIKVREKLEDTKQITKSGEEKRQKYGMITVHRAENTDDLGRLIEIADGICQLEHDLIFPVHPRTRKALIEADMWDRVSKKISVMEPMNYKNFIANLCKARFVLTDSGGVQQEASIFNIPCLTVRDNTEWIETIESGGNRLVEAKRERIYEEMTNLCENEEAWKKMAKAESPFKPGAAKLSMKILFELKNKGELRYRKSNFHEDKNISKLQNTCKF